MQNVCAVSKLARANTMSLSRYQKIDLPSPNLSIGSSGGLGPQAGSGQFFKKLDVFPEQLIDHLVDILAFPASNAL